jgi:hypothetical protein
VNALYGFAPYLTALVAFLGSAYLFTRGPKESRFDCVSPIVQTIVTFATLLIYVGLQKVNISPAQWLPALAAGAALGTYGSWSTTMEMRADGTIRVVRTMWYLAVLAASIGVSQVLMRQAFHRNVFSGGLAVFYFGTGTAVASNVTLLLRAAVMKRVTLADLFAPIASFNWRKGTEGSPWQAVQERMASRNAGVPVRPAVSMRPRPVPRLQRRAPAPPPAGTELRCPKCGTLARPGRKFCRSCGQPLS